MDINERIEVETLIKRALDGDGEARLKLLDYCWAEGETVVVAAVGRVAAKVVLQLAATRANKSVHTIADGDVCSWFQAICFREAMRALGRGIVQPAAAELVFSGTTDEDARLRALRPVDRVVRALWKRGERAEAISSIIDRSVMTVRRSMSDTTDSPGASVR